MLTVNGRQYMRSLMTNSSNSCSISNNTDLREESDGPAYMRGDAYICSCILLSQRTHGLWVRIPVLAPKIKWEQYVTCKHNSWVYSWIIDCQGQTVIQGIWEKICLTHPPPPHSPSEDFISLVQWGCHVLTSCRLVPVYIILGFDPIVIITTGPRVNPNQKHIGRHRGKWYGGFFLLLLLFCFVLVKLNWS